jgi:tetratricopeptide (TPR) repeat protein
MRNKINHHINFLSYIACFLLVTSISGCQKLVEVDFPKNYVAVEDVFTDQNKATSAVVGMYAGINSSATSPYYSNVLNLLTGMQADELSNSSNAYEQFKNNNLLSSEAVASGFWGASYNVIYQANAIIEGITASNLPEAFKNQAIGEAFFIRAFCNFYLVNLYGDVPLITNTLVSENQKKPRSASDQVWTQIIEDLEQAESLLPTTYVNTTRVRANKYAAAALLARVYLYQKNYAKAEEKASEVLAVSGPGKIFDLPTDLTTVFLNNSVETIFCFDASLSGFTNPGSSTVPNLNAVPPYVILPGLFSAFEAGDKRKTSWMGISAGQNYPLKYRTKTNLKTENEVVLRLAEQYLIRAEARAQQNNLSGAQSDFNAVHGRSVSGTVTLTTANYMAVILQERRVELFTEWGHRWFDLKRTGTIDAVIGTLKPAFWQSTDALYPIPLNELLTNPALTPNPGYF